MSERYFYYETRHGDPIQERGELATTGYVSWEVSESEDMSNKFRITVSPSNCSYITVEEMEE